MVLPIYSLNDICRKGKRFLNVGSWILHIRAFIVTILYMNHTKRDTGVLAVYKRPDDFSTKFNKNNLQIFVISKDKYKELVEEIERAVDQFRENLIKVK